MSFANHCVRCDGVINDTNDSEEHVLPNSVGGHLKTRRFICVRCNNETGQTWDKELSEQLNFFCQFFGIIRERGEAPPQRIKTTAGEDFLMQAGGGYKLQKPVYREVPVENGKQIQIQARSMSEAAAMLRGAARKYPQIDANAELAKASTSYTYPTGVFHHNPTLGGEIAGRSIVKTVTAFAHHVGIPSNECDLAIAYLRNEASLPPFGFFYECDLVDGRPSEVPIHCVAISGRPDAGLLLGYVEYFGLHRIVVCLSQSYSGPVIEQSYGLNPLTGQAVSVRVGLPFSVEDLQAIYDYKKIPEGSIERAFAEVVPAALKRSFEQEKTRAIAYATKYAFENCGAKKGEMLTEDQKARLPPLVVEGLMPFIQRFAARA
ncbi:HNH endonuclease [Bradyrhizobium manausense]|uniref:HNH endonuclease n=1 Tax=Bradyrhizobium manausense TaxID=989370 RepID=UPI001BA7EA4C|nr:HNH endonuclease [Bradyrhizobium manausense]MBR1090786.1 HNH endonuclease [Bradyrhizobium manausense]